MKVTEVEFVNRANNQIMSGLFAQRVRGKYFAVVESRPVSRIPFTRTGGLKQALAEYAGRFLNPGTLVGEMMPVAEGMRG